MSHLSLSLSHFGCAPAAVKAAARRSWSSSGLPGGPGNIGRYSSAIRELMAGA